MKNSPYLSPIGVLNLSLNTIDHPSKIIIDYCLERSSHSLASTTLKHYLSGFLVCFTTKKK